MKDNLHLLLASAMLHGIAGNIIRLTLGPDLRLQTLLMLLVLVGIFVSWMESNNN